MKNFLSLLMAGSFAVALTACGPSKSSHADHDHDHDHEGEGGHAHHAHSPKMGGQLIEVGEHQFNVELLSDRDAGHLTLWVLDAHAENYVRLTNDVVSVEFTIGGAAQTVDLKAAANPATGERVGSTAQFDGEAAFLKTPGELAGRLPSLEIRGNAYTNIAFRLTK